MRRRSRCMIGSSTTSAMTTRIRNHERRSGALAGMAVTCEGYHAAYVKLLESGGHGNGAHRQEAAMCGRPSGWTAKWYHVDTTHDDVKDGLSDTTALGTLSKEQQAHLLFGLDDATMALANPSYVGSTPGYEVNSLENNYFIRTGDILAVV